LQSFEMLYMEWIQQLIMQHPHCRSVGNAVTTGHLPITIPGVVWRHRTSSTLVLLWLLYVFVCWAVYNLFLTGDVPVDALQFGCHRWEYLSTYCHEFMAPWLIISESGLDDWIYWHLLVQSQSITTVHNKWLPKTCSIFVFILILRLTSDLLLDYL
jgi:hypothetical protein